MVGISVRPMREDDLAQVSAVESESFPDPWTPAMVRDEFSNPLTLSLVAERTPGTIAGYCFCWMVQDEIDIHSVAVSPAMRRRGCGRALVEAIIGRARDAGMRRITLEVRRGNGPAIGLYRAMGFSQDGVRRGYYSDNEDAVLMSLKLDNRHAEGPAA